MLCQNMKSDHISGETESCGTSYNMSNIVFYCLMHTLQISRTVKFEEEFCSTLFGSKIVRTIVAMSFRNE